VQFPALNGGNGIFTFPLERLARAPDGSALPEVALPPVMPAMPAAGLDPPERKRRPSFKAVAMAIVGLGIKKR
jgi:hypothetical protein